MTPIAWDSPTWGQPPTNVHVSDECGDSHTDEVEQP